MADYKKDECFVCLDKLPAPPEGMTPREHAYVYGFADGVSAVNTSEGPKFCADHRKDLDAALAARGFRVETEKGEDDD